MAPNQTKLPTAKQWTDHIRSLIHSPLRALPFHASDAHKRDYIDSFQDEYTNRRNTDRPFLAYLFDISLDPPTSTDSLPLDEQLWWMVQSKNPSPEQALALINPTGGFLPDETLAIEYRTKVELCALHACWIIARQTNSTSLQDRCLSAAHWHTQELQPDNAINRPWATQVFIALAQQTPDPEISHLAHLHAQTLIHNTSITFGHPDILSALILSDVANDLDLTMKYID
ncbi:MAG: hypothetical protein ACWA5W_00030 [Phycisphaerales bacterium]